MLAEMNLFELSELREMFTFAWNGVFYIRFWWPSVEFQELKNLFQGSPSDHTQNHIEDVIHIRNMFQKTVEKCESHSVKWHLQANSHRQSLQFIIFQIQCLLLRVKVLIWLKEFYKKFIAIILNGKLIS